MFSGKYPAKAFNSEGDHISPGPWLTVIHAANGMAQDLGQEKLFDNPTSTGSWWAGGYVEEYPEARVIHHDDDPKSISIVALSARADALLTLADITTT